MKKYLLAVGILFTLSACMQQQQSITINGDVTNTTDGQYVYIKESFGADNLDSTLVKDGKFTFTYDNVYPRAGFLSFDKYSPSTKFIILEIGVITVTGDAKKVKSLKVEGTEAMNTINTLNAELAPSRDKLARLPKEFNKIAKSLEKSVLEVQKKEVEAEMKRLKDYIASTREQYIKDNFGKVFSSYTLFNNRFSNLGEVEVKLSQLSPDANDGFADELNNIKDKYVARSVGKKAPDFTTKDVDGETFSLSDYKGKVVLLSYWAAWCVPCRKDNKDLVSVYNKYNKDGFEIISLAMEFSKKEIVKASKTDGSNIWRQGFGFIPSKTYLINLLPQKFLIDQNGVIIAENISVEEIEDKVAELLKDN